MAKVESGEKILYTKEDNRTKINLRDLGECDNCEEDFYIIRFKILENLYRPAVIIKCKSCGPWSYKIEE